MRVEEAEALLARPRGTRIVGVNKADSGCPPPDLICASAITDATNPCNTALDAGIHAVNAIVTDGLNRDRIEPPQPTFSIT